MRFTVAMGAHAMYQSRYAKYKRWGFDEATADKRAKQDATILYNSTQQSSEGAFLSPMQVDRSWLSVLFTVLETRQCPTLVNSMTHSEMR